MTLWNRAYSSPKGYDLRAPYNVQMGEIQELRVVPPFSTQSMQKDTVVQSFPFDKRCHDPFFLNCNGRPKPEFYAPFCYERPPLQKLPTLKTQPRVQGNLRGFIRPPRPRDPATNSAYTLINL